MKKEVTLARLVVITAVGRDHPGIVAALTGAIYSCGGNLDDATMTRLHGVFATMLAVQLPGDIEVLDRALQPLRASQGLTITIDEASTLAGDETPPDHIISVYGADKPGIVHSVASALARANINITDMDSRMAGTVDQPIYIVVFEVSGGSSDLSHITTALRQELNLDITVRPIDEEAL